MLISFSLFREEVENGVADALGQPLPHPGKRVKRQTIRAERADGRWPRPTTTAHLWWKSRTAERAKLGELPIARVAFLAILEDRSGYTNRQGLELLVRPSRRPRPLPPVACQTGSSVTVEVWAKRDAEDVYLLDGQEHRVLAQADGFHSWGHLLAAFERMHGLPFRGWVIRW